MKKIFLGRNKKTEVLLMNRDEFLKFMQDKNVYHYVIYWIEKWNQPVLDYFPSSGFTLSKNVTLKRYPYPGYPETCLGNTSTTGKFYQDYIRYKVTIRETKKGNLYYVTKEK